MMMIDRNYTTECRESGPYVKYKSVLTPTETEFYVQGFMGKADNVLEPNFYGEYTFSFYPYTSDDEHRLYEHIETWEQELENRLLNPYEDVDIKPKYKLTTGSFVVSQIEPPVINTPIPHVRCLEGGHIDMRLFLRNGPDASLYLNCRYIDLMDPNNGIEDRKKPVVSSAEYDDSDF